MPEYAIRAEGLSKQYRIGEREPYVALRDVIARALTRPFRRWLHFARLRGSCWSGSGSQSPASGSRSPVPGPQYFWALKDVSFKIAPGEVVGIIGRNGAGKSTLLKILSRITKPTCGSAEVYGRVGSLLEVGTGFHPELSGRDNVYLSGAILGMSSAEITRKFDEIVAFAEVEKFIDTQVKHYSSGMYMRLAFAVAAHLDPEILLVDEVLAVGDNAFQQKCLGKMGTVAKEGRTVLFVSHQMHLVRRLCQTALWIDGGQVRAYDTTNAVVGQYEATTLAVIGPHDSREDGFLRWEVVEHQNIITESLAPVTLRFVVHLLQPVTNGHFGLAILNDANLVVAGWAFEGVALPPGTHDLLVQFPAIPLRPGVYSLLCSLFRQGNNLTGGEQVAHWQAHPELRIDAPAVAHPQEAWAGVLNVPAHLSIRETHL